LTVNFTESHSDAPPRHDLTPLLIRTLRDWHANPDPRAAVLRCLVLGLSNKITPAAIRRWLLVMGTPEQQLCVAPAGTWFQLVGEAKRWRKDSSALQTARRMVARVVAPVAPGTFTSKRQEVQCRVAIAIIGGQLLRTGYDKLLVSAEWLALQMGFSTPGTARAIIKAMEKAKWIRRVSSRSIGNALHYRLMTLPTEELRDWAELHHGTVQSLADGAPERSYLATVLMAAGSPVWFYSGDVVTGGRTWLRLALEYSGHPKTERLGLSSRHSVVLRDELKREIPGALEGHIDLAAALELKCEETFAVFRHSERVDEFAALACANRKRIQTFRAEATANFHASTIPRGLIRDALYSIGPLPEGNDREGIQRWVRAATSHFNTDSCQVHDPAVRSAVSALLIDRATSAGWPDPIITRAIPFIFRDPNPA
jgi:hypothetical protein